MKIQSLLLFCFFSVLLDDAVAIGGATYRVNEGGNVTARCHFYTGEKKIFCKNNCNKEDILVVTTGNRKRNGRYSISFEKSLSSRGYMMSVSITHVTSSDSGEYMCCTQNPKAFKRFTIEVRGNILNRRENPTTPQSTDIPPSDTVTTTVDSPPVSETFKPTAPSENPTTPQSDDISSSHTVTTTVDSPPVSETFKPAPSDASEVEAQASPDQVFPVLAGEDFRSVFNVDVPSEQSQTYLCRNDCQEGDVLMEVHGKRTKSGRYSLRLDTQVHVAITRVRKEDAGFYRVWVRSPTSDTYVNFQLTVKDLCDGGMAMDKNLEYSVSKGSDLTVNCDLTPEPTNRKFLCRDDCTEFLIDTNDLKGSSAKYRVEFVSPTLFRVTIRDLSGTDSGRYRCGVGQESGQNTCQEFRVTVNADSEGTDPVVPIVVGLLVAATLILVILLIGMWKKKQTHLYVNTSLKQPTCSEEIASYYESCIPTYEALRPETREQVYCTL